VSGRLTPAESSALPRSARLFRLLPLVLGLVVLLSGCAPRISQFSATAYEQATALKVESLALMDRATQPYADHVVAVSALETELRKAYEYARGRPRNEISARQWEILIDPERNLLGGFLVRWRERGALPPVFVQEAKGIVADAFDTIIGLESGKVRPASVPGETRP
jgi:hypothetical protein